MKSSDTVPIKSIGNTMDVIEQVTESNGCTVDELANELDLPTSSAHNYLKSLHQLGYFIQEEGEYRIGLQFLKFGETARNRRIVYEKTKPHLKKAASDIGCLANLMVEENGEGIYIYRTKGDSNMATYQYLGNHVGESMALVKTAAGRAILSEWEEENIKNLLEQYDIKNIAFEEFLQEIRDIREDGIAFDDENFIRGLRSVAVPVQNQNKVLGAISLSGPVSQFDDSLFRNEIPTRITDISNTIEIDIQFS